MTKNFIRDKEAAKIPCKDESDFYIFCRLNGFTPERFTTENGWEGVYVELCNGCFVYYYGDEIMRYYEIY
jgi:hypothetical protein